MDTDLNEETSLEFLRTFERHEVKMKYIGLMGKDLRRASAKFRLGGYIWNSTRRKRNPLQFM